jgi:hypothetical protein
MSKIKEITKSYIQAQKTAAKKLPKSAQSNNRKHARALRRAEAKKISVFVGLLRAMVRERYIEPKTAIRDFNTYASTGDHAMTLGFAVNVLHNHLDFGSYLEDLIKGCRHKEPMIRAGFVQGLGNLMTKRYFDPATFKNLKLRNDGHRLYIGDEILCYMLPPSQVAIDDVLDLLIKTIKTDKEDAVVISALLALGTMKERALQEKVFIAIDAVSRRKVVSEATKGYAIETLSNLNKVQELINGPAPAISLSTDAIQQATGLKPSAVESEAQSKE